jgi:hypothetical protein
MNQNNVYNIYNQQIVVKRGELEAPQIQVSKRDQSRRFSCMITDSVTKNKGKIQRLKFMISNIKSKIS